MARSTEAGRSSGTGRPQPVVRPRLAQPVLVRPNEWTLPTGVTGYGTRLT